MKSTDLIKELTAVGYELRKHAEGVTNNRKDIPSSVSPKRSAYRYCQIYKENGESLLSADFGGHHVFFSRC